MSKAAPLYIPTALGGSTVWLLFWISGLAFVVFLVLGQMGEGVTLGEVLSTSEIGEVGRPLHPGAVIIWMIV
jgi:hypothetical protein